MFLTKITIIFGVFIILSSSFVRQLMNFIKDTAGETFFVNLVGLCVAIAGLLFLFFLVRRTSNFYKISLFILLLIGGIVLVWQMKIPEEKIHILEFSILGWLASRDLNKAKKSFMGIIFAFVFIAVVGAVDEAFQAVLPYRYFQWCDIAFNIAGGSWGIILYLSR